MAKIQYDVYHFSPMEWIRYIVSGFVLVTVIGILFFDNFIGIVIISPYILVYLIRVRKKLQIERKWKLNQEFKDAILSLSAALEAGYSMENAMEEVVRDLLLIYTEDDMIIQEFRYMTRQVKNSKSIELIMMEFGDRSNVDDICSFAQVFATAKRTDGDIIKIIRSTANALNDKIEVKREINTLVAAKSFEAKIMKIIPFGILFYLRLFNRELMQPLYGNFFGMTFMLFILIIYFLLLILIDHIMNIQL